MKSNLPATEVTSWQWSQSIRRAVSFLPLSGMSRKYRDEIEIDTLQTHRIRFLRWAYTLSLLPLVSCFLLCNWGETKTYTSHSLITSLFLAHPLSFLEGLAHIICKGVRKCFKEHSCQAKNDHEHTLGRRG